MFRWQICRKNSKNFFQRLFRCSSSRVFQIGRFWPGRSSTSKWILACILIFLASCKNKIQSYESAPANDSQNPYPQDPASPQAGPAPQEGPGPQAGAGPQKGTGSPKPFVPVSSSPKPTLKSAPNLVAGSGTLPKGTKKRCGEASYYADSLAGRATASGEPYSPMAMTAASLQIPLGVSATVTLERSASVGVRVKVNDRGPYEGGRIIDLSKAAFGKLASLSQGVVQVCVTWD